MATLLEMAVEIVSAHASANNMTKDELIAEIASVYQTLARHLMTAHGLKPGQYRKQFGIPSKQSLAAKSYSESRRQMAIDRGLGEGLAKARAARVKKAAAPKANPAPKAKAVAKAAKKK